MTIAITTRGSTLDSPVEPSFGHCAHILLVDSAGSGVEAIANPYAAEPAGAGSRLAALIVRRGVSVVLTGSSGPNATTALEAAGIRTVTGCSGTARQAVAAFRLATRRGSPAPAGPARDRSRPS